ncbi:putative helicase [Cardiosporidium cionae]|uniref:Helicase n=1 Tax=Cardiosporidium cionae TaxID=476202 RepID=A0ABQ7J8B3_9APIC|nr:putative helicase [Cardiosporidium cionae]|eukprot:KAF8820239.1 putative helicase [Cardiosporidium cionae]
MDFFALSLNHSAISPLKDFLKNSSVVKIMHNGKFDVKFLKMAGFSVNETIFDTLLGSRLLEAGKGKVGFKLLQVVERYLGIVMDKSQQLSDWQKEELSEAQLLYAARDASVLLPLYHVEQRKLAQSELLEAMRIESRCLLTVADIELNGMLVNQTKWKELAEELTFHHLNITEHLRQKLNLPEDTTINYNSQPQILEVLRSLGITMPNGNLIGDTNDWTLSKLEKWPAVAALREYRKITKAISAFVVKLPKHISNTTGRIHPNFNQYGAESGRFSCDNPNLQQIPRDPRFRSCFIPSPHHKFVIADFSQIELRKEDLHRLTASLVTGKPLATIQSADRQLAKAVNFGLIYGMSIWKFRDYAENYYGVKLSMKEATLFYSNFFKHYKGIYAWHDAAKTLRPVETRTLSKRRALLDKASFTKVLNYPVQGTSADITKESLANLPAALSSLNARIVMCVHDEIIIEAPENQAEESKKILIREMESAGNKFLKLVPCVADAVIGNSWAAK